MKRSAKVAIGGIFSAVSLLFMLLTLFPYATYALPALAGVFLLPVALECGIRWSFASYAVVAFLSFVIVPSMEAKMMFVVFFGYYPTLKLLLDRLGKAPQWLLKLAVFNVTMVGGYLLLLFVLGLDMDTFVLFGINLPIVFLLLGNVVFWIYDRALVNIVIMYHEKWHPKIARIWR